MTPTPFPQSNKVLNPAPGTEGQVIPLHVHNDGEYTTSRWTLSPAELAEITATGHIWLQVMAGSSSPPVKVLAYNPLGHQDTPPDMPEDEYHKIIHSGHCPWCRTSTTMRRVDGKTVDTILNIDFSGQAVAKIEAFGPYCFCAQCGAGLHIKPATDPLVEALVFQLVAKHSGVPHKPDESIEAYQTRLSRMLGPDAIVDIFNKVQAEMLNGQG